MRLIVFWGLYWAPPNLGKRLYIPGRASISLAVCEPRCNKGLHVKYTVQDLLAGGTMHTSCATVNQLAKIMGHGFHT